MKRIAKELIRLAKEILSFKTFEDIPVGQDMADTYRGLRSLVKSNKGLWKSDKQGKFMLNLVRRQGDKTGYYHKLAKSKAPDGTEAVISSMMIIPYGRKTRFLTYVYWLDRFGIIQEAKVKYKYDDKSGSSQAMGISITWKRPKDVQESLVFEDTEEEKWFKEKDKLIKKIIPILGDHDFFGKFVNKLKEGERPSEKIWGMMLQEVDRLERSEGAESFPTTPFKGEIQLKVNKVKEKDKEFSTGYSVKTTTYISLIGEVIGYKELGYIMITENSARKTLFKDDDFHSEEEYESLLKRRTVTLRGTFNSNGKMIFGKRVKIVGIR